MQAERRTSARLAVRKSHSLQSKKRNDALAPNTHGVEKPDIDANFEEKKRLLRGMCAALKNELRTGKQMISRTIDFANGAINRETHDRENVLLQQEKESYQREFDNLEQQLDSMP